MSRAHEIAIGADAKAFDEGIRSNVIKPLENAEEALQKLSGSAERTGSAIGGAGGDVDSFADKLAAAARKAGKSDDDIRAALKQMGVQSDDARRAVDKLGDEFTDTGRKGERGIDKLDDALKDAQRQSEKTERAIKDVGESADDTGRTGERGMRKFGDAGAEVSGELKQNLGETFSSFRGDLEDLPQIAQDVFGGLAGSVGTLPAAFALAAGAAGVGLLVSGLQNLSEQEEERKERVAEWASAYIAGLGRMESAVASFASVEAIYTDTEKYAEAEKNMKNWGVSLETAVNAMAGDATALSVVQQNLADNSETVGEALERAGGDVRGLDYDMRQLRDATGQGQESFNALTGEMDEGRARAEAYSNSLIQMLENAGTVTEEVDALGNALYTLPDGRQIMIDANTGQATDDVTQFKGDVDGKIDALNSRDVVLKVRVDSSQWDNWQPGSKNATIRGVVRVANGPGGSGGITWD